MLGVVLLYVGIVLINNGIARLTDVDNKSASVMNFFVGALSITINIITIVHGDFTLMNDIGDFYSAATGLLFGFTYLYVAVNSTFNLDPRLYGWYSLFVAINTIPAAYIEFTVNNDWRMAVIWILWGILWLTGYIENVLKKKLEWVPYLAVFEGIVTAWIPGFLILTNLW